MVSEILRILLFIAGYLIVLISLVPLIRKDNWIFRVFEYPRAQKLIINALILIAFLFVASLDSLHDKIFIGILSLNLIYLAYQVFPYTILGPKQMMAQDESDKDRRFRLLVCNVYQYNRDDKACLSCIQEEDPDMVILVETDSWWAEKLKSLYNDFPHVVSRVLDNTYGMMLFSRYELLDPQIRFLVEPDVPSITTKVRLPSGDVFRLYCVHPQPPIPQENPRSTERDAELLIVAREAKASDLPVVVAGDLNDVAWSYTTELFMKISGLLDPRRGRGFFNTFHARHWFLRWPLDHIFCSRHFLLRDLRRLPPVGSDHFPILIELALSADQHPEKAQKQNALEADNDDQQTVDEKIAKVK